MEWIYRYFKIWSIFIPITSVVIFPSIKGTLPSYILAFLSPLLLLTVLRQKDFFSYTTYLFKGAYIFTFLVLISQLGNLIFPININLYAVLNDASDSDSIFFRSSLLTQSLYLIPCFLLYTYSKFFYRPEWDKWINASAIIFAGIGLLKWLIFIATDGSTDGDFLTNRTYGQGGENTLYQNLYILGYHLTRVQSLTGEPSNFALIMVPLFFYMVSCENKSRLAILMVFISIFLSASSTAFLGLLIGGIYYIANQKIRPKLTVSGLLIGIVLIGSFCAFFYFNQDWLQDWLNEYLDVIFLAKMQSGSADERLGFMGNNLDVWSTSDLWHQLFGIGFGVVRSTDLFSTFLVDIGLIGLIVATIFWFYDYKFFPRKELDIYQNMIILSSFFMAMASVPEFSFMSTWLLLGIFRNRTMRKTKSGDIQS